jgi:hypothetical protein
MVKARESVKQHLELCNRISVMSHRSESAMSESRWVGGGRR